MSNYQRQSNFLSCVDKLPMPKQENNWLNNRLAVNEFYGARLSSIKLSDKSNFSESFKTLKCQYVVMIWLLEARVMLIHLHMDFLVNLII